MIVTSANKLIHGLNLMTEAVTTIAAVLEEIAWDGIEDHVGMSSIRPITAARLETPHVITEASGSMVVGELSAEQPAPKALQETPVEAPPSGGIEFFKLLRKSLS